MVDLPTHDRPAYIDDVCDAWRSTLRLLHLERSRAKNIEATLLLITAGIVLLGRTYAGVWLFEGWLPESMQWFRFDNLTVWIMEIPNTAGTSAITIGIALGVVATSLRILLGVDRSYLGQD